MGLSLLALNQGPGSPARLRALSFITRVTRSSRFIVSIGLLLSALFLSRSAAADPIVFNGNFNTGDLSGFTVFTTPGGTNGSGLPDVVLFDITGNGASYAAQFSVGEIGLYGTLQGGGLSQSIDIPANGLYTLSEDYASTVSASQGSNFDGGVFSLLLNGSTIASQGTGLIYSGTTITGSLSNTLYLDAGTYLFQTEVTREFTTGPNLTPNQYFDNLAVVAAPSPAPEPSTWILGMCSLGFLGIVTLKRGWAISKKFARQGPDF